jgi:hypothetical protein
MLWIVGDELFGQALGFGKAALPLLRIVRLVGGDSQAFSPLQVEVALQFFRQVGFVGNLIEIGEGLFAVAAILKGAEELGVGFFGEGWLKGGAKEGEPGG